MPRSCESLLLQGICLGKREIGVFAIATRQLDAKLAASDTPKLSVCVTEPLISRVERVLALGRPNRPEHNFSPWAFDEIISPRRKPFPRTSTDRPIPFQLPRRSGNKPQDQFQSTHHSLHTPPPPC
jgi:hypothetical protein